MSSHALQLSITNDLSEVGRITEAIQVFASRLGISREVDNALQLAAEEILSNIILYGFSAGGGHTIHVDLRKQGQEIWLQIRDDGTRFNMLNQPAPEKPHSLEDARLGGLGIHLVRSMMDEITYNYEDGWNTLLLKKKLNPG